MPERQKVISSDFKWLNMRNSKLPTAKHQRQLPPININAPRHPCVQIQGENEKKNANDMGFASLVHCDDKGNWSQKYLAALRV
ncbi:hypothetical protein HYALB_00008779 [Hymenoscyphus albidus]|uniref:Uncharacterized protein n=1 Tax=Hymenoscyphus albidus TaxID=595503 RepID=A0A9N9QC21_9HELO|nr:hypothetical protein HYALB_00008779 [Hymenoscyphus albidus]